MKKAVAIMMALVMSASLLMGCGGNESDAAKKEGTENSGDETVTIRFFDKNSKSREFDDRIAKELMKRTGVKVEVVNPTGDPAEKLSLMLAGKDYPDIVLMDRGSDIVYKYIEAGALVNLSEHMDKLPNVKEMYGETLNKTRYKDGNNYYLANWYGYDPDPVNGFIMRYDIMCDLVGEERASSDEPFSQDEMVEILRKFKDKYPEINGKESIALTMKDADDGDGGKGLLTGMYGVKTYYEKDGKLYIQERDPRYLEAMHFANDLYNEGLIDKEWVTNNNDLFNQKMASGNIFGYMGAYWDVWTSNASLQATEGEDAVYLAYKVLPEGVAPDETTLSGRSSLGWDAIGITNNCKNLDAALKFVDYCASQEGQDLLLWGIEGEDWTMENGVHTPNPDVLKQVVADPEKAKDELGIARWTWFVRNSNHEDGTPSRLQMAEKDITKEFADKNLTDTYYDTAEFDNLMPTGNEPVALKAQKIKDIQKQTYPKLISASSPEELDKIYEQMISDMEAAGLEEVEERINETYQERMELWAE